MKSLLILSTLFASSLSFADQCQLIDQEVLKRAEILIQSRSEIVQYCEPCGEKVGDARILLVRSVRAKNGELFINNDKRSIDLAYTFIRVAPSSYVNVAKVVGCPAVDVSEKISLK